MKKKKKKFFKKILKLIYKIKILRKKNKYNKVLFK